MAKEMPAWAKKAAVLRAEFGGVRHAATLAAGASRPHRSAYPSPAEYRTQPQLTRAPADGTARRCPGGGSPRARTPRRWPASPRRPARRARRATLDPPKPPPVIRAATAPASTAIATAHVELGAGDLEVVAHRDVRGVEQRADGRPSRPARQRGDRVGDPLDLGDDVRAPGGGPGRRSSASTAVERRPCRSDRHAERGGRRLAVGAAGAVAAVDERVRRPGCR